MLSKKGVLILSVPFVWPVHEEPYDFYRFTEYGLRSNLDKAGFKSAKIIQAGGLWISLGLMFLSFGCKNIQNPNKLFSIFLKVYNKLFVFISNIVFAFLNCKFPCSKIPSSYLVIALNEKIFRGPITVTSPLLPPLEDFIPYLEDIWNRKWLQIMAFIIKIGEGFMRLFKSAFC